jgi:hypothetical protein
MRKLVVKLIKQDKIKCFKEKETLIKFFIIPEIFLSILHFKIQTNKVDQEEEKTERYIER